jgi:hypothetical protein
MALMRDTSSDNNVNGQSREVWAAIDIHDKPSSDPDRIDVLGPASEHELGDNPTQGALVDRRRISQISQWSKRFSRPLSFNGSIWLKDPEDFVPQFEIIKDAETEDEIASHNPPYHVLSRRSKKHIVYLVSLAAMFSPLSSNIYFPAMNTISEVLSICKPDNR